MAKIYTETPATGTEGILIYDPIDRFFLFRKNNTDHTFVDYRLTHPDLGVKIIDEDAAFYEIDGMRYLDISSEGMKRV